MSYIPDRRSWFGTGDTAIQVMPFETFGWKVHQHRMPAGSKMKIVSSAAVSVKNVPNRAMFTAGRGIVYNEDGTKYPDRVPGLFTQERTGSPAGVTTVESVEYMEFWCFNYIVNRRALPELTPVRLMAGESLNISAGTKLFVMRGSAGDVFGPADYEPAEDTTLIADDTFYAFIIAKAR